MNINKISTGKYYIVSKDFQSSIGPILAGVKVLVVRKYSTGVHDIDAKIVDLNNANTTIFAMKSENLEPVEITKLELKSKLSRLEVQAKEITQKLDWMKANQLEVFDEEEFALFEALRIIEGDDDPITKVQALKSIINNFRNEKD
jgi:type II secretory pathway component PulF